MTGSRAARPPGGLVECHSVGAAPRAQDRPHCHIYWLWPVVQAGSAGLPLVAEAGLRPPRGVSACRHGHHRTPPRRRQALRRLCPQGLAGAPDRAHARRARQLPRPQIRLCAAPPRPALARRASRSTSNRWARGCASIPTAMSARSACCSRRNISTSRSATCWPAALREGFRFIDIGANIGAYSLFVAAKAGPTARILAVEPQPEVFARLAFNIAQNPFGTVKAVACALADKPGELTLFLDPANRGESSVRILRSSAGSTVQGARDDAARAGRERGLRAARRDQARCRGRRGSDPRALPARCAGDRSGRASSSSRIRASAGRST